jgi:putative lipase involved disintegration of autophagic bodies
MALFKLCARVKLFKYNIIIAGFGKKSTKSISSTYFKILTLLKPFLYFIKQIIINFGHNLDTIYLGQYKGSNEEE